MITLGKITLKECPESYIGDWSREMIALFHMCYTICPAPGGPVILPAGPPPSHGGMLDQDNRTMEAFQIIKSEIGNLKSEKKRKRVG